MRRIAILALVAGLLAAAAPAAHADHAGPLAGYWPLDSAGSIFDDASFTPDASGHGNNASVSGVALTEGVFGNAFTFNGSDGSSATAPHSPLLEPAAISVTAWVNSTGPGLSRYVAAKRGQDCVNSAYALWTGLDAGTGIQFSYASDAGGVAGPVVSSPESGPEIWDGQWHAVTGTFDGTTVRLYVDGVQVGDGTPGAGPLFYGQLTTGAFMIGNYPSNPSCVGDTGFVGSVDDVRVHQTALTAGEIATLHARPSGPGATPPGTLPPPAPGTTAPAPAGRNVTRPTIRGVSRIAGGGAIYRCTDGTWEGLANPPGFTYEWWRIRTLGRGGSTRIATTRDYTLRPADRGIRAFCRVYARGANGQQVTAFSQSQILTGVIVGSERRPLPARVFGDFRVRGIDVFQTVQPNSSAQQVGPGLAAFPGFCGAGTPTSWRTEALAAAGCALGTRNPARTDYAGVPLDLRKPTTAIVYANMVEPVRVANQPLDITLRARVGGRLLSGARTVQRANLPVTAVRWVPPSDRAATQFGVPFTVPPAWLASAVLSGQRLDLEASVSIPVGAGSGLLTECDRSIPVALQLLDPCSALDDSFRLDGVQVVDDLPELTVRSVEMAIPGQTLNPPSKVLERVIALFPGGERMNIGPYYGRKDVSVSSLLQLEDALCEPFRAVPEDPLFPGGSRPADLRGCRSAFMDLALTDWLAENPQNRTGFNILMGVHAYTMGAGSGFEPGWTRVGPTIPAGEPIMAINDGTAGRPLTAAAHEFGHALGAPHADNLPATSPNNCGGNVNGQVGEAWPPDQTGRLQGTAFGHSPANPGVPVVDENLATPTLLRRALFDLMSYCAAEANAWVSPFNWNRFMTNLRAARAASTVRAAGGPTARAAQRGVGFVSGVAGPAGAAIRDVTPADPGNEVPAADPASPVRVRSLGANGQPLGETGARITLLHIDRHPAQVATFRAPIPEGAAAVEVLARGVVTDRIDRSRPPTVRLSAPRRGTRVGSRGTLAVRWTSSDPDPGTARTATVDYAADGRRFRTVYSGPDTGRASIPARSLEAGRRARVRVRVSDGFNRVEAVSGAFSAAGTPPQPRIVVPARGEGLQAGTALLVGSARDELGRRLRGRSLTWFAGRRRLGTGERLRRPLPAGTITLRLVARDRGGKSAAVTRRVRVAPPALLLTRLEAPERVRAGARSVRIRIGATTAAVLRAGGRSIRVGTRARRVTVPLPARPRSGVLTIRLRVTSPGRRLSRTILVFRG